MFLLPRPLQRLAYKEMGDRWKQIGFNLLSFLFLIPSFMIGGSLAINSDGNSFWYFCLILFFSFFFSFSFMNHIQLNHLFPFSFSYCFTLFSFDFNWISRWRFGFVRISSQNWLWSLWCVCKLEFQWQLSMLVVGGSLCRR